MRGLRGRAGGWTLFALALLQAACAPEEAPVVTGAPPATPPPSRPPEGLLERATLQDVVDLQVERRGPALIERLDDPTPEVRGRAAFALGSVQDSTAVGALLGLLDDPDPGVRRDAAFALGQTGGPPAAVRMRETLQAEEEATVRSALWEALGKTGDAALLAGLDVAALPGEPADVAMALARFGIRGVHAPTATEWLTEALTHEDPEVRRNAAYYFGRVDTAEPWTGRAQRVREALDGYAPGDPAAMHLLLALVRLEDAADTPRLLARVDDPDWRVRVNAFRALAGRVPAAGVRDALHRALDDPAGHVAVTAAETFASVRRLPERDLDRIAEWVEAHPDRWRVAVPLLAVLGAQGRGRFVLEWIGRLPGEPVRPRARALEALGPVGGQEATRVLMEAARSEEPAVSAAALEVLARRWGAERDLRDVHRAYLEAFVAGLSAPHPRAVFVSAEALTDPLFVAMGSVPALLGALDALPGDADRRRRVAILAALGDAGDPEVAPLLRRIAEGEGDRAVRRSAADALEALTGDAVEVPPPAGEPERRIDWGALAALGPAPRWVLDTDAGRVVLVLDPGEAPLTVQTVAALTAEGRYDGTPFHRVVPNFVAQGGDVERGDGSGGPGFAIRTEATRIPFLRGVVGMASSGKDTEGSQFFVTHSPQPHLDGGYTAFGWVVEGMDVVDALAEGDRVRGARIEPEGTGAATEDPGADPGRPPGRDSPSRGVAGSAAGDGALPGRGAGTGGR